MASDGAAAAHGVGLGIDIGGSGIKGAPVDLGTGAFTTDRVKIHTPHPSTPKAVAQVVAGIAERIGAHAGEGAPIGVTFPGVVRGGVVGTAANVDGSWVGTDVEKLCEAVTGRPVAAVNDADAAAVAEHRYGAARGVRGVVLLTTLGTGIGTALITDGHLVPNTEFGHLEIDGHDAETRASSAAKEREGLSYEEWATERLQRYYDEVEKLLSPDLIVVGGGVSRKADKFLPRVRTRAEIVPARLRNSAGIVGAALLAAERFPR
ncbi:polyphosphate--glucose phosphotransferase [Nocardiopsis composta]|uniref:Polyphosphate glucokinase n=1 Tax=Nocardiopsis composta TaxID=157465 RepID=A0A7W8QSX2_9ACTN|nr:ROK family protein [Nocardiopsis composta]MBB5435977.1 polyphosphate glucokinase [Nocardiopsis composta]